MEVHHLSLNSMTYRMQNRQFWSLKAHSLGVLMYASKLVREILQTEREAESFWGY